jgi:fumarate hydratase class II
MIRDPTQHLLSDCPTELLYSLEEVLLRGTSCRHDQVREKRKKSTVFMSAHNSKSGYSEVREIFHNASKFQGRLYAVTRISLSIKLYAVTRISLSIKLKLYN